MAKDTALCVTVNYVQIHYPRAVHIQEVLVNTVVGRSYSRKGLANILTCYGKRFGLEFDGQWISVSDSSGRTAEMIG